MLKKKQYYAFLSNKIGKGKLYIDPYGGFTNSIKKELTKYKNKRHSKSQKSKIKSIKNIDVEITIDFLCKEKIFVQILSKLCRRRRIRCSSGSIKTLDELKAIIIEIRKYHTAIFKILKEKFCNHS